MTLVVALSALVVGMLLAIAPAMFVHNDTTMRIVDAHGNSEVDGGNPA